MHLSLNAAPGSEEAGSVAQRSFAAAFVWGLHPWHTGGSGLLLVLQAVPNALPWLIGYDASSPL